MTNKAFVGKNTYFAIGEAKADGTAPDSLTELSSAVDKTPKGLDTAALNKSFELREIPGGDAVHRQSLEVEDQNLPFSVDYNVVTEVLLFGKEGRTFYWEYGPRGRDTGAPKRTGKGILGVELSGGHKAAMRFSCTLEGDGAVTEGNYA